MNFSYKKVYLTGANGWLGKQMVKTILLGDDDVIKGFNNNGCNLTSFVLENEKDTSFLDKIKLNHKIVKGNICSKKDCDNFMENASGGILIHLAGIIHPKKTKEFYSVNFHGTKNLIESGIKNGIKKFIVMSSNSPTGCNKNIKVPFNEDSTYNPYMNYGKSKMLMEKYLIGKIKIGIDITIIRSPWFYGDFMPDRQYTFYKMVKRGSVPVIGNGENLRSKANLKNIAQGILLCSIKKISKGKIYWIADKENYSYNEIINEIRSVLTQEFGIKIRKKSISLPNFFGKLFWLLDFIIQKSGFYNQKIHVASELNKNIFCSIGLAEKELGYNPKVSLYDGLKKALANNLKDLL